MEFTTEELNFLRNFFNSSDIDRDGMLSRQDIASVMGLENQEQIEAIFKSLKGNATSNPDGITFEEFCQSAEDNPWLLEQFRQSQDDIEDQEIELSMSRTTSQLGSRPVSINLEESINFDTSGISPMMPQLQTIPSLVSEDSTWEGQTMTVYYLIKIFENFQNAMRIDIDDAGATRRRTEISLSNEPDVLIENIKKVSSQLADKIDDAVENETFPPKASDLFDAIMNGVGYVIKGFEESHKVLDFSMKELDKQKGISTDAMNELKIKLDQERSKTRELTDALVQFEKDQNYYEGERASLFEETKTLSAELDRAIKAKSFVNNMLNATLESVKKKQEDLIEVQKEARLLRNHKTIQEMCVKFTNPHDAIQRNSGGFQRTQTLRSNRNTVGWSSLTASAIPVQEPAGEQVPKWQISSLKVQIEVLEKQIAEYEAGAKQKENETIKDLQNQLQHSRRESQNQAMLLQRQKDKVHILNNQLKRHSDSESEDESEDENEKGLSLGDELISEDTFEPQSRQRAVTAFQISSTDPVIASAPTQMSKSTQTQFQDDIVNQGRLSATHEPLSIDQVPIEYPYIPSKRKSHCGGFLFCF